jgi:hypothetical protein
MSGVKFLVDDAGRKTDVILDLRKHRRLWEDIYDRLLVESRRDEKRYSLKEVRQRMSRPAKKNSPASNG